MKWFKDCLIAILVGAGFGGGVLALSLYFDLPIPEPHQRPIFLIGTILFSLAFRLLLQIREENE